MDKEINLVEIVKDAPGTIFEIPLDDIVICNDNDDYDPWNYLEEWEKVNIINSQNRFF